MKSLLAIPLVLTGVTADGFLETDTKPKYDLQPGASCAEGYVPLTSSWQHCLIAAKVLGFDGDSVKNVQYNKPWGTRRPEGCFRKGNGEFHFNDGEGGNSKRKDSILCVLEGAAPPKAQTAGSSLESFSNTPTFEGAGPEGNAPAANLTKITTEGYSEMSEMALQPPSNGTFDDEDEEAEYGYYSPTEGWTKEPVQGVARVTGVCGTGMARKRIHGTDKAPWKWITKLKIRTQTGETLGCTGFFISKRTVITNAHCVYVHGKGGWVSSIHVCPGKNGSKLPYGCNYAKYMWVKSRWINESVKRYDYAAIEVPLNWPVHGYFGFRTSFDNIVGLNAAGYPGEKDDGTTMWWDYGSYELTLSWVKFTADSTKGNSGGPLWAYFPNTQTRCVVGIVAYGGEGGVCPNHGVRVIPEVYDFMNYFRHNYN